MHTTTMIAATANARSQFLVAVLPLMFRPYLANYQISRFVWLLLPARRRRNHPLVYYLRSSAFPRTFVGRADHWNWRDEWNRYP
jgi:hypothetical protein